MNPTATAAHIDRKSNCSPDESMCHAPFVVLAQDLAEISALIERLDDSAYCMKPVGVFESSVGGHVRHCLDHIDTLFRAIETGRLCYDDRQRGTDIEKNRTAAINAIMALRRRADALNSVDLLQPLTLCGLLTKSGVTVNVATTLGRELLFVLSHTTHHNAIIGAMVKTLGVSIPSDFGIAVSTAAFLASSGCAQ